MKVGNAHLGYCTNVHRGESPEALLALLTGPMRAVRQALGADDVPFGTGLRLGASAVYGLAGQATLLAQLRDTLLAEDAYVFTVNGFPYGDFGALSVKTTVYSPSWLDEERRTYTRVLSQVLAALPGPVERTVSTLSGAYKPEAQGPEAERQMARHLLGAAEDLARLADKTGVLVRLCLEPEPWTTLETTADAARFFERHLQSSAEARAHLALCYDCCHQAVAFEDPLEALARLAAAEVPIGKVQISSALHLPNPARAEARAQLMAFDEPRYLHQTAARLADGTVAWVADLPELHAPSPAWLDASAWRCHFHVPLGFEGDERLTSTRADWEAVVRLAPCAHFEVETYTWGVLPAGRFGSIEAGIAEELALARAALLLRP